MKKLILLISVLVSTSVFSETISFIHCKEGETKGEALHLLDHSLKQYPNAVMVITSRFGDLINRADIKSLSAVTFFKEDGKEYACVTVQGPKYVSK